MMKEDIKEILDNPKILMLSYGNYISLDDYVKLKDYITNLQTIEQQYSAILSENAELKNKITNLQEKVNQYENPDDMTLFYMWIDEKAKDKMKQLQEENKNMEHELQQLYLIKDKLYEENKKLKQWDNNKDSRNSRQRVENAKLIKENKILNNIIQTINSVCSSMQFSAPENMYIHLQRMIEILDYWKKGEKNEQ